MLHIKGYADIEIIHQSQNSSVYRAVRESDGLLAALKTPTQTNPSARKLSSLIREHEILHRYFLPSSPTALEIINLGPTMVLALDYINAPALRENLSERPMELQQFFPFAIHLTEIISETHRKNLIHRDLSPGNILYNPETFQVRLIDFGSALEFPRQARAVINPHYVEGSPPYMSPEQTGRMNRGLDYRTDFYSLGAIFYRLLTGKLPHSSTDHNELVFCHIAVQPQPPHTLNTKIPRSLSSLVIKLMSKDAANRYQSGEGIRADLMKCRDIFTKDKVDDVIELAQEDLNDRFILPEKLYGREKDIAGLLTAYKEATTGKGCMAFITGHSGIGKTSLVKELYKPVAEHGGYIASGKFDQYRNHLPYSALMEAFADLIMQIVAESDDKVEKWRSAIAEALGPNGRLLTDVIPGLELLIGPQPKVDELPTAEAHTRFSNVFQNFWQLLGNSKRPMVIFLDDLQWIDSPSLALLETMSTAIGETHLMLIGAYRSNEVAQTHRLAISLTELRKSGVLLKEITLQDLPPHTLMDFLTDTLRLPSAALTPLNEVLLQKTMGNPLFFKTILSNLHTDGHIKFDYEKKAWSWDQEAIAAVPYADNVIEILQSIIPTLSGGHGDMIGFGACLGNIFELNHLALLAGVSRSEAARCLQPAVSAGLILPLDGDYELFMVQSPRELADIHFRFAHDRVQQAAYTLVEEQRKPDIHLRIGRQLLKELPENESGPKMVSAVANLNLGVSLMGDEEKTMLVRLNLAAGKKAKESAAFTSAHDFLLTARKLLADDCWENHHAITLAVYLELAETSYLVGEFDQAEKLYSLIRAKAQTNNDILTLINIQAKQYHHQGRYPEAIALEVEGLSLLGINLPEQDDELFALFMEEGKKIAALLGDNNIESLYDRPEIDDPSLTRTHEILFDLFADGYLMGRGALLACGAAISTRLSIEHGNSPMTSIGFINYATCLCAGGEYVMGNGFGRVAVKLADTYQIASLKNYTYHLFALSINHWQEPLETSYTYWREASKLALESGSPYAGWVFLQLAHVLFASGAPLDKVEEQITESHQYLTSTGMHHIAFMLQLIVAQPVKHLRGKTKSIKTLDDSTFSCDHLMEENKNALFFLSHIPYSMLRATLIGREIQSMETMSAWMPMFEQTMQGQFIHVDCFFYCTLHLTGGFKTLPEEQKPTYLAAIDENLDRFKQWAKLCPANYEHKYLLIAAEKARLGDDTLKAMELYDKAIDSAYASSFLQDAALANELAALFWQDSGKKHLARPYLTQALSAYARWGAAGKVVQLKADHPELVHIEPATTSTILSASTSTGTKDFSAQLDLMSIIKASQAISQHVVLDKLAGELVRLAMQNAGATMAALLLKQNKKFIEVRRETAIGQCDTSHLGSAETPSPQLPAMVLNYVIRSRESVVLDDALGDKRFCRSEYITTHKPQSLCCTPIIKQKEVCGILYLENSHIRAAFHKDRLKVLNVIASQAAISLDNVNIYQKLEDMNKNLEQKVLSRTKELNKKNQELEILSTTDQLTNLYNRRYVDMSIKDEIERSQRYMAPLSAILLDIDHFKQLNDNYGHDVGDEVLVALASILKENTRSSDVTGRWGGEEFLIVAPQTGIEECTMLADKLRLAVQDHKHRQVGQVTASLGVTEFRLGDSPNTLIKRADLALYQAKEQGRNRVVVYQEERDN